MRDDHAMGPAGRLAKAFTDSKLTLLFIVAAILLGFLAVAITPREEEPQILVPMVDVMVPFQGATPREVEERVTTPAEKLLWGIPDVEYIYSTSRSGGSFITLRFKVGTELEPAVVRVHHKLREYLPEMPNGVTFPLIRSYTIDDVPFLALTIHGGGKDGFELRKIAQTFARELSEIPDVSKIETLGGESRQVKILPDPTKMRAHGVSMLELFDPLISGNLQGHVGKIEGRDPELLAEVGGFFKSADDLKGIVIGIKGGRAVRLGDVAEVIDGAAERETSVLFAKRGSVTGEAVTLSFSKRPGTNATELVDRIIKKAELIKRRALPEGVAYDVTRNYGKTAKEKSDELIKHLLIASLSVVALIAVALGIRFSLVVGVAVPVTLSLTLLIYYLFGYTLNRVTLFALIFSIGILVDDAIVVVENIHRHMHLPENRDRTLSDIIVAAVGEVGNPTILATFAVIAAILPMAFVRGLMGPYMRPIPIGASMAMLFSLAIAFTISPWVAKLVHRKRVKPVCIAQEMTKDKLSLLDNVYHRVMGALLDKQRARMIFAGVIGVFFTTVIMLVAFKAVRVKMLPFDNKSEFQVLIDLDEGRPLEATLAVAKEMGSYLGEVEEVENYQIYAGVNAPINFNGLVRHYFLRRAANGADIQVNLIDRHERARQSHEIAKSVRAKLVEIATNHRARVKVVEIPPGPPVLSTLVAEIYGPKLDGQIELADRVKSVFNATPGVVDSDWMVEHRQGKRIIEIDRRIASLKGVPIDRIERTIAAGLGGASAGVVHIPELKEELPIVIRLPLESRGDLNAILNLTVPAVDGSVVLLSDLAKIKDSVEDVSIYHKNLKRVVYVIGDLAGSEESPIYALAKMNKALDGVRAPDGSEVTRLSTAQPETDDSYSLKWDGEWQISYEVFRDLGIAFAVVLVLIYILVVGWFESYLVPLVIMVPIPLSLIGIIPGHLIFGAFFTATSMIGFIAGAGIIVRNSIILVDFIELKMREGMRLREAVIEAGSVRFKPMLLTAAAVVVGSTVILFDPIFQGLAISLMMGEVAATLLSRFAVPLLYYQFVGRARERLFISERDSKKEVR